MKTNRRGFLQTVLGFLAIPFLPKSKASPKPVIRPEECQCSSIDGNPVRVYCPIHYRIIPDSNHKRRLYKVENGFLAEVNPKLIPKPPKFTHVCYCHKPGNHIACNYPKCPDYNPGNKKPYKEFYE